MSFKKKNAPGCKCCNSYGTVRTPTCACKRNSTSFDLHWVAWGYHFTNPPDDLSYTQDEYPHDSPLTYSAHRPESTYTAVEYPGQPGYVDWGPGWYSGIERYDGANHPTSFDNIWQLTCTSAGFALQRRFDQFTTGGLGTTAGWRWNNTSTPIEWTLGNTGPANTGFSATYATGPNTCSYMYASVWGGGDGTHTDDGQDGHYKNGTEYIVTGGGGMVASPLLMASAPPQPDIPRTTTPETSKELVVSRYNEPLDWLAEVRDMAVTVYNKGGSVNLPDGVAFYQLPNTGREAGTMLAHIVTHYDSLAEWTYFVQGTPHADDILPRLNLNYEDTTSLTDKYMEDFPSPTVKARDKVIHVDGVEVRYGRAEFHGDRTPEENADWLKAVWSRWFRGLPPTDWYFGYAAEFAVPRHRILARPLSFWRNALEAVNRAATVPGGWDSDPANAWAFELIWLYLFDPKYEVLTPLSDALAVAKSIKECPFRTGPACGCPSEPSTCSLGKGVKGLVWRPDCETCIVNGGNINVLQAAI